jgi:hypothetical protein
VVALAATLAEPGRRATFIDRDNVVIRDSEGRILRSSIKDAFRDGRAFFIDVAPDVLALDADREHLCRKTQRIADELAKFGYRPILVASGQPNRVHLFCVVRDRVLLARMEAKAKDLGIDVRACIRPALSPHRLGFTPKLLSHSSPGAALKSIEEGRQGKVLSERTHDLLDIGLPQGMRSEQTQSICNGYLRARRTFDEFFEDLWNSSAGERLDDEIEKRGLKHGRRWLRRSWDKGIEYVANQPRQHVGRFTAQAFIENALNEQYPGKNGPTEFATGIAIAQKCEQVGRAAVDYSVRDWQLDTGTRSKETMTSSRDRLLAVRRLKRLTTKTPGNTSYAERFRLVNPASGTHSESHPP